MLVLDCPRLRRVLLTFCSWFACSVTANAATLSLVAVKVNDLAIEPSSSIHVQPGDRIEAEVRISEWGDSFSNGLTGYAATISTSLESPLGGSVVPAGWTEEDFVNETCLTDEHCDESSACCWGRCLPPRALGITIDLDRPDFIFQGRESNVEGFPNCGDAQLTASITKGSGVVDPGVARYFATVRFEASHDACGVFSVGFGPATLLFGDNPDPVSLPPAKVGLRMTVPNCGPFLVSCQPENCLIDPRIPWCERGSPYCRIDPRSERWLLGFSEPVTEITAAFFRLFLSPGNDGTPVPGIASISTVDDELLVGLNRVAPVAHWTCIEYRVRGQACCFGRLPGDVDFSLQSNVGDIFALIDHLKESELLPHGVLQCDIDRSNLCTPADLLMEIDLLVGSISWGSWYGANLPECPSLP